MIATFKQVTTFFLTVDCEVDESGIYPGFVGDYALIYTRVFHRGCYNDQRARCQQSEKKKYIYKIEIRHVYIKVVIQLSCSVLIYEMILHEKTESLDEPVHILILVSVDDSTVFHPCHSGLGDARGLAGQRGLNIDCNSHIQTSIRDGRRHCK